MIQIDQQSLPLSEHISINVGQALGVTANALIREKARHLPEYDWPVKTWQVGQDHDLNPITVDTLGLWLFGVPGLSAHCRIVSQGQQVIIYYPPTPNEIKQLLIHLKQVIESEGV